MGFNSLAIASSVICLELSSFMDSTSSRRRLLVPLGGAYWSFYSWTGQILILLGHQIGYQSELGKNSSLETQILPAGALLFVCSLYHTLAAAFLLSRLVCMPQGACLLVPVPLPRDSNKDKLGALLGGGKVDKNTLSRES